MSFQVTYETTPNPHSLKFVVNRPICTEKLEIQDRSQASRSPLAAKIWAFPGLKLFF